MGHTLLYIEGHCMSWVIAHQSVSTCYQGHIQLLESPIPAAPPAPSQKAPSDDISGTKRGTIDPLVSKRPEKNSE